jgi:hypothetical protein
MVGKRKVSHIWIFVSFVSAKGLPSRVEGLGAGGARFGRLVHLALGRYGGRGSGDSGTCAGKTMAVPGGKRMT